jgi:hypothetical protein
MTEWVETTEERYYEMLGVLPPECWTSLGFLVGEPMDHDNHGRPRFSAFIKMDGKFYEGKQAMTGVAFRALSNSGRPEGLA